MSMLGLQLLDKLLELNPDKRFDADEALAHEYFITEPLPCKHENMPYMRKDCHI